jgi:transposase
MAKTQLITGTERKRRFSDDDRRQYVIEALSPDSTFAGVARKYEISQSVLHYWKKKFFPVPQPFARLKVEDSKEVQPIQPMHAAAMPSVTTSEAIRIHLKTGVMVEFPMSASPESIALFLRSLRV